MSNIEWKYRRDVFYNISDTSNFSDLKDNFKQNIFIRKEKDFIVKDAVNYMTLHQKDLFYPGKSYAVAIMYASWIEDFFKVPLLDSLDDPELLFDDEYFVPYNKDKNTYDRIFEIVDGLNDIVDTNKLPYVKNTREYFMQEFMLDDFGKSVLPM